LAALGGNNIKEQPKKGLPMKRSKIIGEKLEKRGPRGHYPTQKSGFYEAELPDRKMSWFHRKDLNPEKGKNQKKILRAEEL